MAIVPSTLSEWLQATELVAIGTNARATDKWDALALSSQISSPLALRADATAEAARQAEFFSRPIAIETLEMRGRQASLVGGGHLIAAQEPGYENGAAVFVIGAEEREGGTTLLTVLRRIGD